MKHDKIDHPSHYTMGGIEVIDAIEAWDLNFSRGNAVKYIARAGKKATENEIDDLKKARWYLEREIQRLEMAAKEVEESEELPAEVAKAQVPSGGTEWGMQ